MLRNYSVNLLGKIVWQRIVDKNTLNDNAQENLRGATVA